MEGEESAFEKESGVYPSWKENILNGEADAVLGVADILSGATTRGVLGTQDKVGVFGG